MTPIAKPKTQGITIAARAAAFSANRPGSANLGSSLRMAQPYGARAPASRAPPPEIARSDHAIRFGARAGGRLPRRRQPPAVADHEAAEALDHRGLGAFGVPHEAQLALAAGIADAQVGRGRADLLGGHALGRDERDAEPSGHQAAQRRDLVAL